MLINHIFHTLPYITSFFHFDKTYVKLPQNNKPLSRIPDEVIEFLCLMYLYSSKSIYNMVNVYEYVLPVITTIKGLCDLEIK